MKGKKSNDSSKKERESRAIEAEMESGQKLYCKNRRIKFNINISIIYLAL